MVLICGVTADRTIRYLLEYIAERCISYVFFDLNLLVENKIFFDDGLIINRKKFSFDELSGVFTRLIVSYKKMMDNSSFIRNYNNLIFLLDRKLHNVINKPSSLGTNFSKPYQLYLASAKLKKIKIPKSVFIANRFINNAIKDNYFNYIYKSVSSTRSIVKPLAAADLGREITCPTVFQQKITGHNIRVHVIDEIAIPIKIESDKVDYRYYNEYLSYQFDYQLPKDIIEECISLTKFLNLRLSGIDLIEQDGEYYLLEINTCPGYDSFEEIGHNTKFSDLLVKALLKEV